MKIKGTLRPYEEKGLPLSWGLIGTHNYGWRGDPIKIEKVRHFCFGVLHYAKEWAYQKVSLFSAAHLSLIHSSRCPDPAQHAPLDLSKEFMTCCFHHVFCISSHDPKAGKEQGPPTLPKFHQVCNFFFIFIAFFPLISSIQPKVMAWKT